MNTIRNIEIPDFHTQEHEQLPAWHQERMACFVCTPDEMIDLIID